MGCFDFLVTFGQRRVVLPVLAEVGDARVGDTIIEAGTENEIEALPGYTEARGVGLGEESSHPHSKPPRKPGGYKAFTFGTHLLCVGIIWRVGSDPDG